MGRRRGKIRKGHRGRRSGRQRQLRRLAKACAATGDIQSELVFSVRTTSYSRGAETAPIAAGLCSGIVCAPICAGDRALAHSSEEGHHRIRSGNPAAPDGSAPVYDDANCYTGGHPLPNPGIRTGFSEEADEACETNCGKD